jgi:hypothetical protein
VGSGVRVGGGARVGDGDGAGSVADEQAERRIVSRKQ